MSVVNAGARGWYVMLQRGKVRVLPVRGLCIQGFMAGAVLAGIPVGAFFDVAAPGLFVAVAIGRQGCFLTGWRRSRPRGPRLVALSGHDSTPWTFNAFASRYRTVRAGEELTISATMVG